MLEDLDRAKVGQWQRALDSVFACHGADRAFVLADEVVARDRGKGALAPHSATMPYLNTIPPQKEDSLSQREPVIDHRIRSLVRWNVVAIVLRAGTESSALVGDVASFRSAARLCDVGFQHFFRIGTDQHGDDLLFILGHPFLGICARSFVEGRFAGDQLRNSARTSPSCRGSSAATSTLPPSRSERKALTTSSTAPINRPMTSAPHLGRRHHERRREAARPARRCWRQWRKASAGIRRRGMHARTPPHRAQHPRARLCR